MWLGHVLVVGQLRGRRGLHAHAMAAGALDNVGARAADTGQPGSTSSPSRLKHVLPSQHSMGWGSAKHRGGG